jgi:DNA polymerase III epsilon subunit-like protein
MKILFIDLETTGKPVKNGYNSYYPYKDLKKYDNSRIIQIAMLLYEKTTVDEKEEYVLIKEYDYIIKPDNFTITNHHIHGIDQDTANLVGLEFKDVIKKISPYLEADYFVAHNVNFDKNVLLSELYRYKEYDDIKKIQAQKIYCTCENTKQFLYRLSTRCCRKVP